MLLNCFAQPTLLTKIKKVSSFEDLKEAPLLLCHKNALDEKLLPADWSGTMYATQEILHEVEHKYTIKPTSTQVLCPNEVHCINMAKDKEYQFISNSIEIIVIPWDEANLMYLIKDDYVTDLFTDMITEDMTVFVHNKILRNNIKTGIDVLYVNDGIYNKSMELNNFPSECLLGALVTLVRPRNVKGLVSEEQLPAHIVDCCVDPFDR